MRTYFDSGDDHYGTMANTSAAPPRLPQTGVLARQGHAFAGFFFVAALATLPLNCRGGQQNVPIGRGWVESAEHADGSVLVEFKETGGRGGSPQENWPCHILLMPSSDPRDSGVEVQGRFRSGGDVSRFALRWRLAPRKAELRGIELRYEPERDQLSIEGQVLEMKADPADANVRIPVVTGRSSPGGQPFRMCDGDVFVVRMSEDYEVLNVERYPSPRNGPLTIAEIRALFSERAHGHREASGGPADSPATLDARPNEALWKPAIGNATDSRHGGLDPEQSQAGVTVRLLQLSVDRIYDIDGFLARYGSTGKPHREPVRNSLEALASAGPLRLVRVRLSYTDTVESVSLELQHPDFRPRHAGNHFVALPASQPLPHLEGQPGTHEAEAYVVVPASIDPDHVFPLEAVLTVGEHVFRFVNLSL